MNHSLIKNWGGGTTFQYKNATVVYVFQTNQGVSAARNTGLQYVHNEYIVFADPDDTIVSTYFETLNEKLLEEDADILIFGFNKIKTNNTGEIIESKVRTPRNLYSCESKGEIIQSYLPNIIGYSREHLANCKKNGCLNPDFEWGAIWRCCYSAKLILSNKIKFNVDISLNEDSVFNFWCCTYANKLKTCEIALYNYYMRNTGALSKLKKTVSFINKMKMVEERCAVITLLQQWGYGITEEAVYGSCILSVIELMVKSKSLDYGAMKKYIGMPVVRNSIQYAPRTGKIQYDILFSILKKGLWKPAYFILNMLGKCVNV